MGLSAGWELGLSAQPVSSAALSAKQSKARIQKRFIGFPLLPRRAGDLVAEIAPLIIVHQCQIGLAPVQGHLLTGFGVELERVGGMRLLPAAHLHAAPCKEKRLTTGHIVDRLDIVRIARIGGNIGKADHRVVKGQLLSGQLVHRVLIGFFGAVVHFQLVAAAPAVVGQAGPVALGVGNADGFGRRGTGKVIGGGGALLTGLRMNRTRKLEQLLDKVVGERDNIPLPELFAAAGVDAARGRAAVKSAIEHGYFGADAYIDNRTDTLVVRGAAPQPKKPAQAPTPKAHPAAEDEYAALLRQLREVNDAIPDPVMSQKISRLEEVSGRIFALAQKDPDKKAQLQKFMNYYLPTALKLLNTYASLSGQAVEGTNITEAKHSIERSMDLLVTAFENQLDKLFQADALDVNADIAALEGMLNLDGLTGSEFTR